MIEAFKQVFFGMFWFTLDCGMIFLWVIIIAAVVTGHRHD